MWNFEREKEPAQMVSTYPRVEVLRLIRTPGQETRVRCRLESGNVVQPVLRKDRNGACYFRAGKDKVYWADLKRPTVQERAN